MADVQMERLEPALPAPGWASVAVRGLARRAGRDARRVHEDMQVLAEPGLVERDAATAIEASQDQPAAHR